MTTIFIAGFHHETNTFAPSPADWAAFTCGAGYPAYARGDAMLAQMAPTAQAIGGFIAEALEHGWTLKPSVWAGAMPSNRVTADAFERICAEIVEDLRAGGFDAVFLDLHGAGVAECADDAEGELLARVRAVVGPSMPIVTALDLHANVTERMLTLASAMTAYRTYPHVDMRATGARAARMLARRLVPGALGRTLHAERVPFLLPLNAQCTLVQPAAAAIALIEQIEAQHDVELNFAMGFSAADFAECGPVLFGYGVDPLRVRTAVQQLHAEVAVTRRADWKLEWLAPRDAVEQAIALALEAGDDAGPVVIADTQDNPGAGGSGDTTGLLAALLTFRAPRSVLGLLYDPEAAVRAHQAGEGRELEFSLGGRS
ncbi:MAG TPA: M81 family metallopeptidase, partial [Burkholderiaceae bacterium]|nr:M81 family metallopeptidase [Burkholderiaceae bacterium]